MITLRTGVPGSGKTAETVAELVRMSRSDELSARPVFVHGIPDLAVPFVPLPVFHPVRPVKGGGVEVARNLEADWSAVPDGAIVVIDEAQHVFPPRGSSTQVPGYVAWLNTHRHRGIDLVLITQHPRLIDTAVRKLVGKHQHYRRVFGWQKRICYEWDYCSEALQGMAEASKRIGNIPKDSFAAYKSAELHTKPKMAKPVWLAIPVLALVGLAALAPRLYGMVQGHGLVRPDPVASAASAPGAGGGAAGSRFAGVDGPRGLGRRGGQSPGVPFGRPSGEGLVDPSATMPAIIAGCWVQAGQCRCVTNEMRVRFVETDSQLCQWVADGRLGPDPARPTPQRVEREPSPDQADGAGRGARSAPAGTSAGEPARAASAPGHGAQPLAGIGLPI